MTAILEFFHLEDFVPLALIVTILWVVGSQMAKDSSTAQWMAVRIGACGFVGFAVAGIATSAPTTPEDFLIVLMRSLMASGLSIGLSLVMLPIILVIYRNTIGLLFVKREKKPEPPRVEAKTEAPVEKLVPALPVPPPTPAERATAAQLRYDERLQMLANAKLDGIELKAAQERARQQYLRELDGVL